MNYAIPFNKPDLTGKEMDYIKDAVSRGKISGNGFYTQKCHEFFQEKYGFKKCLITTSCTDALEMAAILCDIEPGDEVIIPSYTFVSTVNAFVLRGATIVFADSRSDHPGIYEDQIEELITPQTKVIVPVHYAGVACDMDKMMALAKKYNLLVVEDAAQGIDSFYKGATTGFIGSFGVFFFSRNQKHTMWRRRYVGN
jgi:dTDP-4-amino-4,6-dideoxygalactose transaminase